MKTTCCDGNYVFGGDNHTVECEKKITKKWFSKVADIIFSSRYQLSSRERKLLERII